MNREELIVRTALHTIDIEASTVAALKLAINKHFIDCVNAIFSSCDRLVITGIGKSALVGHKIVATLNSTGTPALFMHAADAIHGDLGMIRERDMVLCISKSGETPEIKVLIPLLKQMGNKLIGMVSNPDSSLGRHANYILHTPIDKEADPNNLAPTASTTAQMVLGDALATSLLKLKGFSPRDFALFHPGGTLGKQLYLRVCDIYPNNEKPVVSLSENIRNTIMEMTSKRLGATAVLDENQKLKGIITDGDLRRMLERKEDASNLTAADIMSANPKIMTSDELAVKALNLMRENSITQLIIVNKGEYLGMIHLHDLIREGII